VATQTPKLTAARIEETKVCLLAVAKAAERNPEIARAFVEDGHEIVSHGYRWLDYQTIPEDVEREHVRLGIETIESVAGVRPVGWMTGRPSANTRRLHLELGGFLYDRDALQRRRSSPSSSQLTRRWREMDSNHRYPAKFWLKPQLLARPGQF
jgi:peptidoglycan/xylan/chitin deacetylase (PgdA/CDA1 family)